jgi:hypothetical protein
MRMPKQIPFIFAAVFALQVMETQAQGVIPCGLEIPHFIGETDTAGLQRRFEGQDKFVAGGGVAVFDCDGDGLPEIRR